MHVKDVVRLLTGGSLRLDGELKSESLAESLQ
jgi:hypothetical protein